MIGFFSDFCGAAPNGRVMTDYQEQSGNDDEVNGPVVMHRCFPFRALGSLVIKSRLRWLAVIRQRAMFADRVRPLKDPVLPGG